MKVKTVLSHDTMKTYLLLIPLSAFCLHGQPVEKSTPADATTLYNNGLTAIANGNVVEGEANLRAVLKLQPNNPDAKYQLNYLILHRDQIAARYREKMMGKVTIKAVDFADATLSESLTALTLLIEEQTGKKFSPNFIIRDPEHVWQNQKVTLKLENVPAAAVLKYILSTANGKATYDEHAVVITPLKTS